ncbi:hypothetical protein [Streptomyces sp. MBT62]|uniref:hypothetical protein n=1 Tax=Streptomyces sp. MBT62 TaxID=2800410 RepID=UPI00190912A7|nr:hypothetical protein [Streptomyces sp. MBT62]MBK3567359.1 hypothetical protein [Streptomyces sp. MBT62]
MLWTVLGGLACVLAAIPGTMALTTGWLPSGLRDSVVRPWLWGCGGLLTAAGLGTEWSLLWLGSIDFFGPLGFALIVLGFVCQSRARRHPTLQ